MDFVEEFGFGASSGLRIFFGGNNSDLEGLTFGEGQRSGGPKDTGFVGDGEVRHG
jgi:hypothetical protein